LGRIWKQRDCFRQAMDGGRREQLIAGWRNVITKSLSG